MKFIDPELPKDIEPFDISIKIESVEDAIKIYCMFNHAGVTDSFKIPSEVHCKIRDYILLKCPDAAYYKDFFEKADKTLTKEVSRKQFII